MGVSLVSGLATRETVSGLATRFLSSLSSASHLFTLFSSPRLFLSSVLSANSAHAFATRTAYLAPPSAAILAACAALLVDATPPTQNATCEVRGTSHVAFFFYQAFFFYFLPSLAPLPVKALTLGLSSFALSSVNISCRPTLASATLSCTHEY